MVKRVLALILVMAMCGFTMTGCSTTVNNRTLDEPAGSNTNSGTVADNNPATGHMQYETLESGTEGIGKKDIDSSWDINSSTTITLNGATATVSGEGAAVSGNTVTITSAGTYVVSGTLSKGQIVVNATKDDDVRLVLNGIDITADKNAAIYASVANKLVVVLVDGTINKLTDNNSYAYADFEKEEPDGTLFAKCDLAINGSGTLIVNGNFQNAIRSKDDLVIVSGTFIINAVHNGLHGKDSVMIVDGQFDITAGNDGIKSSSNEKKGWVEIRGGAFNIAAEYDGIQAETDLLISGGEFDMITGGGSANAPVRTSGYGGMGGRRPGGPGSPQQASSDEESRKCLKAKTMLYVADGALFLDAYDDAVHSNNEIHIAGGTLEIKTGDDGIHADVDVFISGGEINIVQSFEGIEGLTVTITGGNIRITSGDDGINVSQGEGKALNGGRPTSGVNQNALIRITGGIIDVHGGTDGLDSNGHIYMEGGLLMISGPSQGMEGAIDLDGTFLITGGEIISAGSWCEPSKESAQPSILVSYSGQQPSGSVIAIKDANGNVILAYTSRTDFSISGFTSPHFKVGESFSLYIDGEKRTDIQLTGLTTTISDTGGAYAGNDRGGPQRRR